MTDDERVVRLADLAQRMWPGATISHESDGTSVITGIQSDGERSWTEEPVFIRHPRALDALEAALLVLADEARIPLTADQVTRDALESCRRDREALVRRIREERAAMEQLAEQWERDASTVAHCEDEGAAYQRCAQELRARAKRP